MLTEFIIARTKKTPLLQTWFILKGSLPTIHNLRKVTRRLSRIEQLAV